MPTVPDWLRYLPFTQLIDIINDVNYPLPIRINAASVAKRLQTLSLRHLGGNAITGTPWMVNMIERQMAQTSGFAQIYNEAPIIHGPEYSAYPTY
jgi:hypothetical protein